MPQRVTENINPYGPLLPAAISKVMRKTDGFEQLPYDDQMNILEQETRACRESLMAAIYISPVFKRTEKGSIQKRERE